MESGSESDSEYYSHDSDCECAECEYDDWDPDYEPSEESDTEDCSEDEETDNECME